jgi:hypothetical protein
MVVVLLRLFEAALAPVAVLPSVVRGACILIMPLVLLLLRGSCMLRLRTGMLPFVGVYVAALAPAAVLLLITDAALASAALLLIPAAPTSTPLPSTTSPLLSLNNTVAVLVIS